MRIGTLTYEISQLLGLNGLWAADLARSPLREAPAPAPLPLRSRSAHMPWIDTVDNEYDVLVVYRRCMTSPMWSRDALNEDGPTFYCTCRQRSTTRTPAASLVDSDVGGLGLYHLKC